MPWYGRHARSRGADGRLRRLPIPRSDRRRRDRRGRTSAPGDGHAAFRAVTGATPGAFLLRCRLAEAQRLLLVTAADVGAVAHAAGLGSTSSFYAHFTREEGESPTAGRRGRLAQRQLVREAP